MGEFMRKFIIKFISVVLVVVISINNLYMAIAKGISVESVRSYISSGDFFSEFIYDDDGNKTDIFRAILELTTLDEETVIKLMENDTVDRHLTDIVNSIYDYNLTGDSSYKYTGDRIYNIVEDNIDSVMLEINYNLSSSDRREVFKYMDNNMEYIIDTIYSTDIGGYVRS